MNKLFRRYKDMDIIKPEKVGVLVCNCNEGSECAIAQQAVKFLFDEIRINGVFNLNQDYENHILKSEKFPIITVFGKTSKCQDNIPNKDEIDLKNLIDVKEILESWNFKSPENCSSENYNFTSLSIRIAGEIALKARKILDYKLREIVKTELSIKEKDIFFPNLSQYYNLQDNVSINGQMIVCLDKKKIFSFMDRYEDLPLERQKDKILKLYKIYNRPAKDIPDSVIADALYDEYKKFKESVSIADKKEVEPE
jgi:hypothetical protein